MIDFVGFPKLARLSRDVIITEKLDGTNAQIAITPEGEFYAGSRTRWVTPEDDNYGFAAWAYDNREDLLRLGPGNHFGEWWGRGIQRNYSMTERRFSLFNTTRWEDPAVRPVCCHVVPVLYTGPLEARGVLLGVEHTLKNLMDRGSEAAPGFMKPEGICVYHAASGQIFKKTLEKDEMSKSQAERAESVVRETA